MKKLLCKIYVDQIRFKNEFKFLYIKVYKTHIEDLRKVEFYIGGRV